MPATGPKLGLYEIVARWRAGGSRLATTEASRLIVTGAFIAGNRQGKVRVAAILCGCICARYTQRDTRADRVVAIKVLPSHFDEKRLYVEVTRLAFRFELATLPDQLLASCVLGGTCTNSRLFGLVATTTCRT